MRSITCDGCITNIKTFELLGCNLNPNNIQPKFKFISPTVSNNENSSTQILPKKTALSQTPLEFFCILDPCHAIKLLRNAFAEVNLSSPAGNIDFKYVQKLHILQEEQDQKLANSLSGPHITFKQKNECSTCCTNS